MPRTRIVCTLGPATDSDSVIADLIDSGMSVARLNFSHGTPEDHLARIDRVRRIASGKGAVVALLGDLQGPKIRVGEIPGGERQLSAGETVELAPGDRSGDRAIPVTFSRLLDVVRTGEHLLLDDGSIELVVSGVAAGQVQARVVTGGVLKSHKGVNFPDTDLPLPSLTEKDRADLQFAMSQELDYLALSFVRRAEDVAELRSMIRASNSDIPIIAKIEKPQAVAAIDAILQVADSVMVARGDLGVEMPAEQVPIYQKQIILKANALGKPVITATQMLESMIHNPRPTRAEASDVANAILDGSDAVMLSAETAIGQYPVESVRAMARIANFTEKNLHRMLTADREFAAEELSVTDAIGQSTVEIARQVGARLILTLTMSGYTARMVARHRPETPTLAATVHEKIRRRLALVWGAQTVLIKEDRETEQGVRAAMAAAVSAGFLKTGERVVVTSGVPTGIPGQTNMIQVRQVGAPAP